MASLVSPNLIAILSPLAAGQGMAICGTDRVNKDEAIILQLTVLQWDNRDAKEYLLKGRTLVKKKYIQAHIITTAYHAFILQLS